MGKKIRPLGVFEVPLFNTQVAVFDDLDKLQKYHTKTIGEDAIEGINKASLGMCIRQEGGDGRMWFYLFISPGANIYTRIHECSHLVDWICDLYAVPIDVHNTEVRAYMMADVCKLLDEVLGDE